jgi:putative endonuclease
MLTCADGTLYTGYTTDVTVRLKRHNGLLAGGAKYTRTRRPVALCFLESHHSIGDAKRREFAIKQLTHSEKVGLSTQYQRKEHRGEVLCASERKQNMKRSIQ